MVRCVECLTLVQRIINPDTNTVERCPLCGESVDKYVEFGSTQRWIDIALLQKQAWVHSICNEERVTLHYVLLALMCCSLEAFVVATYSVLSSLLPEGGDGTLESGTAEEPFGFPLQVVKVLQSPKWLEAMSYPSAVPPLMFYAAMEYLLLLAVGVWLGTQLCSKGGKYEEVLTQWVRAVSLASAVKVGYSIFLIWKVPVSLLPLLDYLFFVWLARGIFVLTIDHSWAYGVPGIALCLAARTFFRQLTHWNAAMLF